MLSFYVEVCGESEECNWMKAINRRLLFKRINREVLGTLMDLRTLCFRQIRWISILCVYFNHPPHTILQPTLHIHTLVHIRIYNHMKRNLAIRQISSDKISTMGSMWATKSFKVVPNVGWNIYCSLAQHFEQAIIRSLYWPTLITDNNTLTVLTKVSSDNRLSRAYLTLTSSNAYHKQRWP